MEGPGCHGLAGAPRPRGAAHGGGPGRAGAGGRAQVSTEGGGQGSCARDRGSVLGSSSSSVWDRAQSPRVAGLRPKEGSGSSMLLTNGNVELNLHAYAALPSPGLAVTCALETSWRGWRGGLEGQGWPHRAGEGIETLPSAEKQEGAIRCPKPRSFCSFLSSLLFLQSSAAATPFSSL